MGSPTSSEDAERDAARRQQDVAPHVFVQLADAYRREGLLDEAIQICRDGLAAHPGYASGRAVLAQVLLERGALDEADQEFRRVLEQVPDHLLALRCLGEIYARKGRAEEARRYYERALRLEPGDPETQDRLAALPVSQEAGAVEHAALPLGVNRDPLASPTLAALYASQGHTDLAEVIYSQLAQSRGEAAPASTARDISRQGAPASLVLEKLLALREAARKVREADRPDARPDASHDR